MSKLIAFASGYEELVILNAALFSSKMKQRALLFDSIGVVGMTWALGFMESYSAKSIEPDEIKELHNEIAWLQENGFVFEPTNYDFVSSMQDSSEIQSILDEYTLIVKHISDITLNAKDNIDSLFSSSNKDQLTDIITELAASTYIRDAIRSRILALDPDYLNKNITAVSMVPYLSLIEAIPNSKRIDVLQVVINKLPIPNNITPWEKIIDYRNDSEAQENLLSLRRWIRKISSEILSPVEIEEELEWLIGEFNRHMRLHKIKSNTETLETIVKAPLEILEDIVKFKFSKIPEPLFAVKKRQISLMEAEINAPGREIAYIVKARDAFSSTGE